MWFQKFCSSVENFKDEDGIGRACTIDHEQLQAVVEQNPHQSLKKMSQTLGVSTTTIY